MPAYDSQYTGQQMDTAIARYLSFDTDTFVTNTSLNTTLEDYLTSNTAANTYVPLKTTSDTGVFLRGDNTWSNTFTDNIYIRKNGDGHIGISDGTHFNDNTFCLQLDLNPTSGNHGVWSTGYLSGETFTSDPKWIIFRDSSGNVAIPNKLSVNEKIETPWMRIVNDSSQTADDALLYVQHRSNNDWNILIDCYGYDYGLYVKCNAGANNAIKSDGVISGTSIKATNGYLYSTANSNTVTIGSQNNAFTHIYNSVNIPFIFNQSVLTTTGNLGNTTYPWNNIYMGKSNGAGIYYCGSNSNNRMIRFINNTADSYGNGISIGGGGQTIIGGGESADAAADNAGTGGSEIMYVCNDGDVLILSNMQNGWGSRKTFTFNTAGNLSVPGTVSSGSSYLIKENIKDFSTLEAQKLLKVRTVSFDFKENWGEKNQCGVIAEEVEKIIPNIVLNYGTNNTDINADNFYPKEVSYIKFIPYLIKMIQIQQEQINQLREKIS